MFKYEKYTMFNKWRDEEHIKGTLLDLMGHPII